MVMMMLLMNDVDAILNCWKMSWIKVEAHQETRNYSDDTPLTG
jgi:hypothetical protein